MTKPHPWSKGWFDSLDRGITPHVEEKTESFFKDYTNFYTRYKTEDFIVILHRMGWGYIPTTLDVYKPSTSKVWSKLESHTEKKFTYCLQGFLRASLLKSQINSDLNSVTELVRLVETESGMSARDTCDKESGYSTNYLWTRKKNNEFFASIMFYPVFTASEVITEDLNKSRQVNTVFRFAFTGDGVNLKVERYSASELKPFVELCLEFWKNRAIFTPEFSI